MPRPKTLKKKDPLVRFNQKWALSTEGEYDGTPCWEWAASKNGGGYGQFSYHGKLTLSHRWSYEHFREPIPEGFYVLQHCGRHGCVNPAHLYLFLLDYVGKRFGTWSVLRKGNYDRSGHMRWVCRCDCGRIEEVLGDNLKRSISTCCRECKRDKLRRANTTHGLSKTKEYKTAHARAWKKRNKEMTYSYVRKRNALKNNQLGNFSPWMERYYRVAQKDCCAYCGIDISQGYHLEHPIPLSRGGLHCWTNTVLACRDCNLSKHTKTAEEFLKGV
ncbi:hypothetical protein LCGC14_1693550 [marine sediment metagenome]|uniref:HNH nuclease domain-containing protein n=1 Tax=marine sediment metagenome TaxID=412755 RepID=A0A0F9HK27_9ZZZZ